MCSTTDVRRRVDERISLQLALGILAPPPGSARCEIDAYTQWDKTYGKGQSSGPHRGTHIWPKHNNILAAALEDEKASSLIDAIRMLRKEYFTARD